MFVHRFATEGSLFAYAPPSLCHFDGETEGAGGGGAPAAPAVTDERSAAASLESSGLLDQLADDDGDAESGASAPDAGADESGPTGEDEGHSEPEDGESQPAAIEPPKSWSDEDKALFGKLPPDAQAVIAKRESERDAAFNSKAQEAAEIRKAAEADRAAAQGQRQQYQQELNRLTLLAIPEAQALANVDWVKLSTENPAEYVRLMGVRDQLRARVAAIQTEQQRIDGETRQEQAKRHDAFLQEQRQHLVSKVPEFGDAEKGKKLTSDLRTFLAGQGFNDTEIGAAADHRLIALAVKAMRAEQAETARAAAQAKVANTAPSVQRPGTAAATGDNANRRIAGLKAQATKTGSMRDAVSLLEAIL